MLKVYGSPLCPDCIAFIAALNQIKEPYDFVDITASMPNLKEFLALRDTLDVFADVKEAHSIGIPLILNEDGKASLDYETWLISHQTETKE
jgi:glutaredoxin-related protein